MKIRKNLEAVFLVAAVLGTAVSYASAKIPAIAAAKPVAVSSVKADPNMPVVVIKGQRLTAAEKAALR